MDPEATTIESYVLVARSMQCLQRGNASADVSMAIIPTLAGKVQHAGPSFDVRTSLYFVCSTTAEHLRLTR